MTTESDREKDSKPTPEEERASLLDYLKDAKPGSPKYMAITDHFALENLNDEHTHNLSGLADETPNSNLTPRDNRYHRLLNESNLRITEMELVQLKRDIRVNEATMPGYKAAYYHILRAFDDIMDDASVYRETVYEIETKILESFEE